MLPEPIMLDGQECLDVGWGIIRPPWTARGQATLYMKPIEDEAKKWAVCYISTMTGNCQGIYYVMRVEDAERFVRDKRTKGVSRGHPWAYFQTSIFNFIQRGGIAQARFTHDTGKMNKVLEDLGIEALSKSSIEDLMGRLRYAHPSDIRGLMPGVIYEVDGTPIDINVDRPRDITDAVIKLDREGHSYRTAVCDGWVNLHSNLAVDAVWNNWTTITYDNKYR